MTTCNPAKGEEPGKILVPDKIQRNKILSRDKLATAAKLRIKTPDTNREKCDFKFRPIK